MFHLGFPISRERREKAQKPRDAQAKFERIEVGTVLNHHFVHPLRSFAAFALFRG
jgi:hypothetical protein